MKYKIYKKTLTSNVCSNVGSVVRSVVGSLVVGISVGVGIGPLLGAKPGAFFFICIFYFSIVCYFFLRCIRKHKYIYKITYISVDHFDHFQSYILLCLCKDIYIYIKNIPCAPTIPLNAAVTTAFTTYHPYHHP